MSVGCHKARKRLPATEIHTITRELTAAATSSAANSEVRTDLAASDEDSESRDRLSVILHTDSATASGRAARDWAAAITGTRCYAARIDARRAVGKPRRHPVQL